MTLLDTDARARFDGALDRATRGDRLDAGDALALLEADGEQFDRLLDVAGRLRDAGLERAGRPGVITYSRKAFIPLTTLCRDRCHYCVFVDTPGQLLKKHKPTYMSPEQVLTVARQAAEQGCKEALLTLGDRPEDRWPEARAWLDEHGYASTLEYVGAMARLITAETGMLAHLNPGVMTPEELAMLRPTAPSMGVMLETTSRRLYEEPGLVHYGSPDKDPDIRLQLLEDAGSARVPFTTGILVGIGENLRERAESIVALRDTHERHGHVQEVIVQNFRAKPRTAMQNAPDAELVEYVAAVAVTRLVMGKDMRVQVPPNLSDPQEFDLLVRAGADDWGGVSPLTADHVNPERPWPHLDDLAEHTAGFGFALRERLTVHPRYIDEEWLDPQIAGAVSALADPRTGLARTGEDGSIVRPVPRGTGTVDSGSAAPGATPVIPTHRPSGVQEGTTDSRSAQPGSASESAGAKGDPESAGAVPVTPAGAAPVDARSATPVGAAETDERGAAAAGGFHALLDRAASSPGTLNDPDWERLLTATGNELDALTATADDVRRYTVGEAIGIVPNRNVASTLLRHPSDPDAYDLDDLGAMARDAWDLGLTEICVQGNVAADQPAEAYLEIARAIKRAAPGIHLHAFRPADIADLADRGGLGLDGALAAMREAGVDTVPGTGVKILSERVRAEVAPADLDTGRWVEVITAAHRAGFSSTSVMFYGHAETAAERIAHLRELRRIQAETGGFNEFVPIPMPGWGRPLVEGRPGVDEHRAMAAVSRLMLSGSIPHIQIPWTRHGTDLATELLGAGGDDLGGTLLDGRVGPRAGVEAGQELPIAQARRIARKLFRPLRQRTTTYAEPAADRKIGERDPRAEGSQRDDPGSAQAAVGAPSNAGADSAGTSGAAPATDAATTGAFAAGPAGAGTGATEAGPAGTAAVSTEPNADVGSTVGGTGPATRAAAADTTPSPARAPERERHG